MDCIQETNSLQNHSWTDRESIWKQYDFVCAPKKQILFKCENMLFEEHDGEKRAAL